MLESCGGIRLSHRDYHYSSSYYYQLLPRGRPPLEPTENGSKSGTAEPWSEVAADTPDAAAAAGMSCNCSSNEFELQYRHKLWVSLDRAIGKD